MLSSWCGHTNDEREGIIRCKIMTVSAVAIALASPVTAQAVPAKSAAQLLHNIHRYVKRQHHWSYWGYTRPIKYHHRAEHTHSLAFRAWILDLWKARASRAYDAYQLAGLLTQPWACIHHYEGPWNANTGNGYYGGLQMDVTFQLGYNPRAYAHYGTADRWPIRDQIVAARRAFRTRGYTPWPNTARMCGLL